MNFGSKIGMKLKDIVDWPKRWATPHGTQDANAPVADGILLGLSPWGKSIIVLVVQCPEGKYFGSITAPANVYDLIFEFLKHHRGRTLCEIVNADLDISGVTH